MLKLFKQRSTFFGLDISDVSLKLMEFESGKNGFTVKAYSGVNIPKEALSGDAIKDPKLLVKTIKQAVANPKFGKITTADVVVSIPETKSFVRVIQMPAVSEQEAQEAVAWEAEAYIPLPIGQVYLDWLILSATPNAEGKITVLITASPKDYIDDYVAILKGAGLSPLAVEVESQATARSLVSQMNEAVLIADINTMRTSFIIYDRGILQFTSSLPLAGNVLTESIAKALNINFEKAEKLKQEVGLDEHLEGGRVRRAMLPVLNNLVDEIKNTIRFHEEHGGEGSKISHLLLSGGSSKLKHLPSYLHEKLTHQETTDHPLRSLPGIKVELGNPWTKVLRKGQVPPMSREDSLSYATAIGLALRDME